MKLSQVSVCYHVLWREDGHVVRENNHVMRWASNVEVENISVMITP